MKSLEDLKVHYDMTVRNENGNIVQFAYGGDNFDPQKVEKQQFELIQKTNEIFVKKYKWGEELKEFDFAENDIKLLTKEFAEFKKLRKKFQIKRLHNNDYIYLPINIYRIVKQSKKLFNITKNTKSDILPSYLFKCIKNILKLIKINCDTEYPSNELNDYNLHLMKTLIKSKLSSKIIIYENKLTIEALDWIIKKITTNFYKALIQPGESVGAVCASSIGEPCTQLSVVYDTEVRIKENNKYSEPKIGKLIDTYMSEKKENVIKTHITEDGKPSYILPIPREWNIKVPGLNYKTQKVEWKHVTEFSKHPPNGKLIKIKTKSGKIVIATPAHSFVTCKNNKPVTIRGEHLVVGDVVPIMC